MSKITFNNHVSEILTSKGDVAVLFGYTGINAGKVFFANTRFLTPVKELSFKEKSIELMKGRKYE